jgi:hypothetical protein
MAERKPIDRPVQIGKVWHLTSTANASVTLCGKPVPDNAEWPAGGAQSIDCRKCSDIALRKFQNDDRA